ncbi:shufflon system plasmid conjugative transfer pilus tip adhesin PilV [Erwinia mallotivora]|uniref:shufflon system plasmid conjugative transfer pilus tip adhesin PilV n=1 Tax=Erwinia mallotivora TaxID=69222 RepID=UPI0021BE95D7|nr:shufflon system plasmid conjugative transfer pilus tip adhesin PilV [Erwinia mallotivora]
MLRQPHTDRGWAILSTGAALIILLLVSAWGYSQVGDWLTRRAWMNTAAQTSRFTQTVKSYTGRYYDTLLAGAPVTVTPAMLKNTGFLEQGFSETTTDGQGYQAVLIRNATNTDQLQAMIYTQGGTALPFMALRQISMDITSGMGGYIWTAGVATGAAGGWSVPLSGFGVSATQGHIAALLTADELGVARGESDRLYRFSVTGKPDLNTMHTSIDMGGNNLNNTGTVNAVTGAFSGNVTANATVSGQNVTAGTDVTAGNAMTANNDIRSNNGWFVTRDGKGWLNETYGGGFYMSDNDWVRAVNNKNIYTAGQIKGGSLRADGRLSTGEVLQLDEINTVDTECSINGLVSRNTVGQVLSCQNRVWKLQSVPLDTFTVQSSGTCLNLVSQTAYCPTGSRLVSGGYMQTKWTGGANNSPDSSYPDVSANGWTITTPNNGSSTSCFVSVASCARL